VRLAVPRPHTPAGVEPRAIAERLVLGALREQDLAYAASASAARARHLSDIAHALAVSLNEGDTRSAVGRVALPRGGSWCVVDVVEPDGSLHRLPAWHPDPAKRTLARTLERRWPSEGAGVIPERMYGVPVSTGRFQETLVVAAAGGHDSFRILHEIGFDSLLVFPLIVRARVRGAITFVSARGDAPLTKEDVALADGIAAHCAMALDNANLYQQAEALRAAADAANRAKSAFLAAMSHELRTPLNAIAGFAELIDLGLQGPVSEDQRRALGRIKANQTHLTALISEILEFAQAEAGEAPHHEVAMSMPQAIEKVAQRFAERASAKQLMLVTDGGDRHAVAWADPQRVRQVLVQLVMNAIEHTPAGGHPITLVSRASGDLVRTYVTDSGPGIPPDRCTAIFEPFVQLRDGRSNRRSGVGLGLATSRSLARAMKGDLTVESTVGLGSRFILTLPRATSTQAIGGGASRQARVADAQTRSRAFRDDRTHAVVRLRDVERVVIERAMEATGGNQSVTARLLGISRPTLLRKLKSYGGAPTASSTATSRDRS